MMWKKILKERFPIIEGDPVVALDRKELHRVIDSIPDMSQWEKVIDEALVVHDVGILNPDDSYIVAKEKLNKLFCINADITVYFQSKETYPYKITLTSLRKKLGLPTGCAERRILDAIDDLKRRVNE